MRAPRVPLLIRRASKAPRPRDIPDDAIWIRDARPGDLEAMFAIEQAVFPGDRMSWRSFQRHVDSSNIFRVADLGRQIVGYALLLRRSNSKRCRLYSLAVSPHHRGLGIGDYLLEDIETRARLHGGEVVSLEVRQDNPAAIALYRSRGYVETGRIAGYYDDGTGAFRFEKALPRRPRTAKADRVRH